MKTEKIICYFCKEKKGIAKRILVEGIEKETEERYKKLVWTARGFKRVGNSYLCKSCDKKKCEKCMILLSNKRICRCGTTHGAFYKEHPEYCKLCWDKKQRSEKK